MIMSEGKTTTAPLIYPNFLNPKKLPDLSLIYFLSRGRSIMKSTVTVHIADWGRAAGSKVPKKCGRSYFLLIYPKIYSNLP